MYKLNAKDNLKLKCKLKKLLETVAIRAQNC